MEFKIYEDPIPDRIAEDVANACEEILGSLQRSKYYWNLSNKKDLCLVIAMDGASLVGFKIGYGKGREKFYSWMGGVVEKYRRKGIAQELMNQQHQWCKSNNFKVIETQTINQWKEMLIFNIRNGFEISGVRDSKDFGLKIILEKKLN